MKNLIQQLNLLLEWMFNECSFPWHKLLTRLTQQNCFVVYRLNLIHEFTSFFSTKVIFAGMPKKTFPRKQAFVDRKQGPRFSQGQPKGYWAIIKWKNLIEPLKHLLEWMLYERWRRLSIQSSTCQHVATLQFVSSAETDSAYSKRRTASSVSDQTDLSSVATHGDFAQICMI